MRAGYAFEAWKLEEGDQREHSDRDGAWQAAEAGGCDRICCGAAGQAQAEEVMPRIGINSWASPGGQTPWEVQLCKSHVAGAVVQNGGLRFFCVRSAASGREFPHWRFRRQLDAVRWKNRMNIRYP